MENRINCACQLSQHENASQQTNGIHALQTVPLVLSLFPAQQHLGFDFVNTFVTTILKKIGLLVY
jgi:hypothetical protein